MTLRRAVLAGIALSALQAATPQKELLRRLPLRFEKGTHATYIARGQNFLLTLAPTQNSLEWKDSKNAAVARVRTRLVGANTNARMDPEDRLPGSANYFVGPAQDWRTDVAGFRRVRYRGVYAGIDLVFHGGQGRLEYDFVIAPHSDPASIQLELTGNRGLRIDATGELIVATDAGDVRWKKPDLYQEISGARTSVDGRFVLKGKHRVGFAIDAYDTSRALVIDPVLLYSTYLGTGGNDAGRGIGIDAAGNIYIAGTTSSTDLPTTSAYQANFGGRTTNLISGDAFVAKFSPAGALLYLTYLGGAQDDYGTALAVDATGNAYLTGSTTSPDFPTVNAYQSRFGGTGTQLVRIGDAFLAKLNPAGNQLLFSTYLGGNADDIGLAITLDSSGNIYIAGATASSNFPLTATALQSKLAGTGGEPNNNGRHFQPYWDSGDAFVAKFDPTGAKLLFSTFLGGRLDDAAFSIAVDASYNVYVGGCTISPDFPTTTGVLQPTYGGTELQNFFKILGDGFVAKLNSTGSALVYSTYFGRNGDDCVNAIALDASGNVYMTGSTSSRNLPVSTGAFQRLYGGYFSLPFLIDSLYGDAFVAKLDPAGANLIYLSYLGGTANDGGTAIAVDAAGNAYVAGFTDSTDFPMAGFPLQAKLGGDRGGDQPFGDAFIAMVNPTGTALLYSSYFGGNSDDIPGGMVLDGSGNLYVTGNTRSTNFPTAGSPRQGKFGGFDSRGGMFKGDAFYAVFSGFPLGPPVITKVANAESGEAPIIAPNTWIEIKGANLAPKTRIWADPDFINGQMPTSLEGVSVTVNGKNAFVYYISGTQINVLTPPDIATTGSVQVQVTNASVPSAPFAVTSQPYSLAFFAFSGAPYVLAQHLDYSLVGPTNLIPGFTTPAKPGETIIMYANGYGPTSDAVISGSVTQSGTLPTMPVVQIGGAAADVSFAALVSPGLYMFIVKIPDTAKPGDNDIKSTYAGQATVPGTLITIGQ